MSFEFVIEDGVSIPKREIDFAPRGTQYPFEQMRKGQSFALPIHGTEGATKEDGTVLTAAEDAKRKATQKQSYFSSLGKKLGINVVTRYFPEGEDGQSEPSLRVWHNGERTAEQKAKDAERAAARANKATATEGEDNFDEGEENLDEDNLDL